MVPPSWRLLVGERMAEDSNIFRSRTSVRRNWSKRSYRCTFRLFIYSGQSWGRLKSTKSTVLNSMRCACVLVENFKWVALSGFPAISEMDTLEYLLLRKDIQNILHISKELWNHLIYLTTSLNMLPYKKNERKIANGEHRELISPGSWIGVPVFSLYKPFKVLMKKKEKSR